MSKITYEEVKLGDIVVTNEDYYFKVCDKTPPNNIWDERQDSFKPNQLYKHFKKEDLEWIFKRFYEQPKASEIERLKEYENMEYHLLNKSDNTITMPEEQYHEFELELINKTQTLNAIRKVVENEEELVIEKTKCAYKNGKNSVRREIKQILDDELPFTDLPKDYSDGEVK